MAHIMYVNMRGEEYKPYKFIFVPIAQTPKKKVIGNHYFLVKLN